MVICTPIQFSKIDCCYYRDRCIPKWTIRFINDYTRFPVLVLQLHISAFQHDYIIIFIRIHTITHYSWILYVISSWDNCFSFQYNLIITRNRSKTTIYFNRSHCHCLLFSKLIPDIRILNHNLVIGSSHCRIICWYRYSRKAIGNTLIFCLTC